MIAETSRDRLAAGRRGTLLLPTVFVALAGLIGCGAKKSPEEGGTRSYFPVTLGSYLDYDYRIGTGTPSTGRIQVVSGSGTRAVTKTSYSSTPSYSLAGLLLADGGVYREWSQSFSSSGCTVTTYAPPEVILPRSTAAGYSETTTTVATVAAGGGSITQTRVVNVDGLESVTVPAGTFTALKVTASTTVGSVVTNNVTWWVEGIGRVKILNYSAAAPGSETTWELSGRGNAAVPGLPDGGGDGSWLTFDPSGVNFSVYEGDAAMVDVVAHSTKVLDGPVYVGVIDTNGVLDGVPLLDRMGQDVTAHLSFKSSLAVGTHTGTLEVRVCMDSPLICALPWGGPWTLPYQIDVLPGTNLTPLASLTGAGPWQTVGGDPGHTGYVPATVDPANFSRRWALQFGSTGIDTEEGGIAAEGGRVFLVRGSYLVNWTLSALSEDDGAVAWTYGLGGIDWVSAPAIAHGHVYVTTGGQADTALWALDQVDGALASRLPMTSQWDHFGAPEVFGDAVYSQSGTYGGLSKFDGINLTSTWWSGAGGWFQDPYTSLADADALYQYIGGKLRVLNAVDGKVAFEIDGGTYSCASTAPGEAPVQGSAGSVFHMTFCRWNYSAPVPSGRLQRFDVAGRTNPWSKNDLYNSEPVFAEGVLYVVNGTLLEALDADTGDRLWSWTIPDAPDATHRQQVLVVGKHAFVTSDRALYAVDLQTHEQVWSHPAAGRLAVSENGVLYVLTHGRRLVAINLQ